MKGSAVLGLALMAIAAVPAASLAADVRPVFRMGLDGGGDEIVTVIFSGGSKKSIKANEGFYVGVGASILLDSKDIEVETTLSYKYANIRASNGDVSWTRVPLDVLVFYRMPKFRVGGGLTYHMNPTLNGTGVVSGLNIKVDDALGVLLQGDILLSQRSNIGLRYTNLSYKANGVSANSNGVGITFGVSF